MGLKSIKVENYSQNQYEIKGNGYKDKKEKEHFFRKDPYAGYKDDKELIKIKERSLDLTKVKNYVKEIALLAIATVLIGIGYSNYSEEETMQVASLQNEASIGDARLVSSNAIVDNDETEKDESNRNLFTGSQDWKDWLCFGIGEKTGSVSECIVSESGDLRRNWWVLSRHRTDACGCAVLFKTRTKKFWCCTCRDGQTFWPT